MGSSNFSQTILGEAVGGAVTQLASQLDQNADRLPKQTVSINGLVADANGGTVSMSVRVPVCVWETSFR
jgi:hypothetical protein